MNNGIRFTAVIAATLSAFSFFWFTAQTPIKVLMPALSAAQLSIKPEIGSTWLLVSVGLVGLVVARKRAP